MKNIYPVNLCVQGPGHAAARLLLAIAATVMTLNASRADVVNKADSGTDLTVGTSWGGTAPGALDVATWNGSALGTGLTLGSSVSWGGINVLNAASDIGITGAGTLTLGASGIDLSVSAVNLSLTPALTSLDANQNWTVAAGKTLTIGASQIAFNSRVLTVGGAGNTNLGAWGSNQSGTLTKTGSGTLTTTWNVRLVNSNVNIQGGVLSVQGAQLYGNTYSSSGAITITNGAVLELQNWSYGNTYNLGQLRANADAIVINNGRIRMTGSDSYHRGMTVNSGGATLEAGPGVNWTLGTTANIYSGNPSLTFTGAGNGDFQKILSGGGGLTKSGAGTWQLTGANSYTGNTTVSEGTLKITGSGRIYNAVHSTAVVTVQTGGVLELDTWSYASGSQSLGMLAAGAGQIVINNGTIRMNGTTSYGRGLTVQAGGATFEAALGANWTQGGGGYTPNVYTGNPSLTFTGAGNGDFQKILSGGGGLTKSGAGTWQLTGANSYTGNTTVSEGTLKITGSGRVYNAVHSTAVVTVQTGGVLELDTWSYASGSQSLGMLAAGAGQIVINNGTIRMNGTTSYGRGLTVQAGGATFEAALGANWTQGGGDYTPNVYTGNPSLTFTGAGNGTFDKVFSGSGSLTKAGAGTWILSRANSYSGTTTIEEGTLRVNGTHTGGGLITVKSGATLGGSGTMVNVTAENGGILSPGSSAGSITMGDLTLNADSILNLELDNLSSPSDKVIVTNYFDDIGGKLNVSGLPGLGTPDLGTSWLVIDYTAAIGSRNNGANLSLGTNSTGLNLGLDVSQVGKVLLVVVPEPASAGLLLMGLVFILRARKGRQL